MNKVVRISSQTPLSVEKISDPKHWQACYKGFGKREANLATQEEFEAFQILVNTHCRGGITNSYADRLLWVFCLHLDDRLADLALHSLSSNHSDTIGFEWLSETRRRNLIRLLQVKLNTTTHREKSQHLLQLAVSIANRGLGSSSLDEVRLAGSLLSSLSFPLKVIQWLPLESPKAQKRREMLVFSDGEHFLTKQLRVHFLHQILAFEHLEVAATAEKTLADLHHTDVNCVYQYDEFDDVKSTLSYMLNKTPKKKEKSYTMVMRWRGYQINLFLTDTRMAVRNEVEKCLKNTPLVGIREFINMDLLSVDRVQLDQAGQPIEYTVTRAQIHASFIPMTIEFAEFYRQYRDEELGKKTVSFLDKICSKDYLQTFGVPIPDRDWLDEVVIEMLELFPFNVRRKLARSRLQCDMYFHHFLQPGLPLHALDAIKYVDWDKYQDLSSPQDVETATAYLERISRLNPNMQDHFREKFGVEPQVLN